MASTSDHDGASTSAESSNKNEGSHEIFPGYTSVSDFSQVGFLFLQLYFF